MLGEQPNQKIVTNANHKSPRLICHTGYMNSNLSLQFGSPEYHRQVVAGEHPPAMFATPQEIIDHYDMDDSYGSTEELLRAKHAEADAAPHTYLKAPASERQSGWYGGLTQRIKESGYDWSKPVEVDPTYGPRGALVDGNHRVAVMHRDRPDEFIPIRTTTD